MILYVIKLVPYTLHETRTAIGSSDRDNPIAQIISSAISVVAFTRPEYRYVLVNELSVGSARIMITYLDLARYF